MSGLAEGAGEGEQGAATTPAPGELRPDSPAERLAFGVLPSTRTYRLGRARLAVLADEVAALGRALGRAPRVLDAGVGQCKVQRLYQHHHSDLPVEWHGLDLLAYRLELRLEVEGIRRVQGSLDALPYRDGAFDAVVCSWVLQHLRDPAGALREMARVLRPGGLLLLAVPNGPPPLRLLRELVHPLYTRWRTRRGREFPYNAQIQFYDLGRVRRLVRAAGLEPRRWQGLGFVTGGPLGWLEDLRWYYRLNLWLGARLPGLTQSLVCVAERPA
ncbi:MAG: class I SAM-dependent methyltransferase [Planctomycetota bacterium]